MKISHSIFSSSEVISYSFQAPDNFHCLKYNTELLNISIPVFSRVSQFRTGFIRKSQSSAPMLNTVAQSSGAWRAFLFSCASSISRNTKTKLKIDHYKVS